MVIADYVLLPSTDSEGEPLIGPLDIRIWVTDPETGVALDMRSDHYKIDDSGRLLIGSYWP